MAGRQTRIFPNAQKVKISTLEITKKKKKKSRWNQMSSTPQEKREDNKTNGFRELIEDTSPSSSSLHGILILT